MTKRWLALAAALSISVPGLAQEKPHLEKATFAGGCFWCIQPPFARTPGVVKTTVGYTGGGKQRPTYEEVGSGTTGHAESIEILFDPAKVSYRTLVDLFFRMHNPTQKNRQGPDFGTQYRSVIFTHGEEQARIAAEEKAKVEASGKWKQPVVTQIEPAPTFWKAEESHQRYFQKHGGSCHVSFAELQAESASSHETAGR